jgi:hypothetical protein
MNVPESPSTVILMKNECLEELLGTRLPLPPVIGVMTG